MECIRYLVELVLASMNPRALLENCIIALFYVYFACAHIDAGMATGQWLTIAPMITQETLLAIMFLCRRNSRATSPKVEDWLVAIIGTFAALLIRPTGQPHMMGAALQLTGLSIAICALLSLRRSIGIVAADRGIVTTGAYRIVRHPMYTGHSVCLLGYLLSYLTPYNAAAIIVTYWALYNRMEAEEKWLSNSIPYRRYKEKVMWRLVPNVY